MIPDWLKAAVILAGIVGVVVVAVAPEPPRYEKRIFRELSTMDGQFMNIPAPDFELRDLSGRAVKLSDFKGKVVFLNLWATWCKPCRDEIPSMVRLAAQLGSEREFFEIVAVSWDSEGEAIGEFLRSVPQMTQAMTILVDPDGELTQQLGTRLLPETYVIDRDGNFVARFQNLREWDSDQAMRLFTALIRRDH